MARTKSSRGAAPFKLRSGKSPLPLFGGLKNIAKKVFGATPIGMAANALKGEASIQTFGSALKGGFKDGNCNTWYVMEMAEKRAMSRAVLKLTGFYELGVFGEDESEDFKKNNNQ